MVKKTPDGEWKTPCQITNFQISLNSNRPNILKEIDIHSALILSFAGIVCFYFTLLIHSIK